MEHIESKNSSESKLQTGSICFITILNILEPFVERVLFSKFTKYSTPLAG